VNLNRRKVSLFRGDTLLKTYPIAVGRLGWETPTGTFQVNQMLQNPDWIHPFTNEMIPTDDPRNPLGKYWIGFWSDGHNSIGFHGTPDAESVGSASSHGCIRMYNQDIEELFHLVQLNTTVTVVQ
jgi:lipoprotein-anchoring transpeptidase ErfK/SrfK